MAAYDDLNVRRIFAVGIISILVTAVTALAVDVLYHALMQWQSESKSAQGSYRRQEAVLERQAAELSGYGVDPATGNVTIPIDRAIELVVQENKQSDEKKSDSDEI